MAFATAAKLEREPANDQTLSAVAFAREAARGSKGSYVTLSWRRIALPRFVRAYPCRGLARNSTAVTGASPPRTWHLKKDLSPVLYGSNQDREPR